MSATPQGTLLFHQQNRKVHAAKIRKLGELTVSALAVGTYLGATDDATDRLVEQALLKANSLGVNFFDTAVNYRCQRAERCIAYVFKKLSGSGISRDQLVISTKGGFLAGDGSMQDFKSHIQKSYFATGIITPEDIVAGVHCMTPGYLQSQINLSLANLKLDCIDLYYLHNPETQIPHVGEFAFYKKLTEAFALFEKNVADGKIKSYGLATWDGLRQVDGSKNYIDIDQVMQCARSAGGVQHHLRAVQLPYNIAMLEAVALRGQRVREEDAPIIPAAVHHGLSVLISAPLMQGHVLRMPDALKEVFPRVLVEAVEPTPAQLALQFVTSSPGVIAAMVGMKTIEHVKENCQVLSFPNWEVADLQQIAQRLVKG